MARGLHPPFCPRVCLVLAIFNPVPCSVPPPPPPPPFVRPTDHNHDDAAVADTFSDCCCGAAVRADVSNGVDGIKKDCYVVL